MDPSSSISTEPAVDEQAVQVLENNNYLKSELYKAAFDGNAEAFNVDQGSLHCLVTPNKNTVLHVYLAFRCYEFRILGILLWKNLRSTNFVEHILKSSPSLLLQPNAKGEIPLHVAAEFGDANTVKLLIERAKSEPGHLERGIEPAKQMLRMTDNEGNTALHKTVRYGHLDVVHALIQEDPDFSYSVNKSGETPLYIAARRGYHRLVTVILDECKSANHDGPCGRTALHAAVMAFDIRSTREILQKRENLKKAADENGQTPLHYAAHFGYRLIVKLLLECDESAAYTTDKEKMTPLLMAARQGHYLTMREIINHCPGCCEIVDKRGWNCFHFAAVSLSFRSLKDIFRVDNKYKYSSRFAHKEDINGNTPFQVMVASGLHYDEIAKGLNNDVVTVEKENLDSKKKVKILQLLDEVGRGEVAGVAVRPLCKDTVDQNGFDKEREARSVVAALITTVTFAAAFKLPGGYKSDQSSDNQGTAILSHNSTFKVFLMADSMAFVFSLLAMRFYYLSARPYARERRGSLKVYLYNFMRICSQLGEAALVVAFFTGLCAVLKKSLAVTVGGCIVILCAYFGYSRLLS